MELCSGDLRGFLKEQKVKLEISQGIYIIGSVAQGVRALHKLGIVHRDIKPENVFWTKTETTYIFKLGDFGLGKD
jgi:serine/threonine protein kinase